MKNPLKLLARKLKKTNLNPLGKPEKDAQQTPFLISCKTCGKQIDLEETTCPKSVKKHIIRNWKSRAAAQLILSKLNTQCSECAMKSKPKPISKEGVYDLAQQAINEAKEGNTPIKE